MVKPGVTRLWGAHLTQCVRVQAGNGSAPASGTLISLTKTLWLGLVTRVEDMLQDLPGQTLSTDPSSRSDAAARRVRTAARAVAQAAAAIGTIAHGLPVGTLRCRQLTLRLLALLERISGATTASQVCACCCCVVVYSGYAQQRPGLRCASGSPSLVSQHRRLTRPPPLGREQSTRFSKLMCAYVALQAGAALEGVSKLRCIDVPSLRHRTFAATSALTTHVHAHLAEASARAVCQALHAVATCESVLAPPQLAAFVARLVAQLRCGSASVKVRRYACLPECGPIPNSKRTVCACLFIMCANPRCCEQLLAAPTCFVG